ncbi:uncharacterized protein I303_101005 [Kwoniella dejecticola CBS 10117]|uniref:Uncharacterized protein n=1 Tax=Kwoniella dejecticola CBS 10117 TaxID=1296121 RepID=A0AAJ8MEN0_9TREE
MSFFFANSFAFRISLVVLAFSLIFPRFKILQTLLFTPMHISSAVCLSISYVLWLTVRSDRRVSPKATQPVARTKHALRQLRFTTPAAWSAVLTRQAWEENVLAYPPMNGDASTSLNDRLNSFLRLIRLHFILPWYGRISASPAFSHSVEGLLRHVIGDITGRAENVDWPDMMVHKVLPIISDHVQHYRSVEHLASTSAAATPNPALPLPLPRKSHPALSHHPLTAAGTSPSIAAHLRGTLARIVERVIPQQDQSEVVSTIVREIALGAVLLPVFEMLCDPDFWNRQIDEKGGRYLREREQVDKFLTALSALPASSKTNTPLPSSKSHKFRKTPSTPSSTSISANSSSKQFDAFLKSISKLKTLGDARRLRADVERELRTAKLVLADEVRREENGKDGNKILRRAQKYVQRLERAKVDIDHRVGLLSGQPNNPRSSLERSPMSSMILEANSGEAVNLYSILSDPSSLAYWLEHMDRRGRSRLVQYWLTVEGFKDPLEVAGLNNATDGTSQSDKAKDNSPAHQTIAEDVAFLYEMYFAAGQSEVGITAKHRTIIEEYAERSQTSLSEIDAQIVKHAVFASQKEVYEMMVEDDWPSFKKGQLYIKAVADLQRTGTTSPVLPSNAQLPAVLLPSFGAQSQPDRSGKRPPVKPIPHESSRSLFSLLSPSLRSRQSNKQAENTPVGPPTPTASFHVSPPLVNRSSAEGTHFPLLLSSSASSPGAGGHDDASVKISGLATPPPIERRSSHLDFLIAEGEDGDSPKERDRLFGGEEEEENEDRLAEAQRIEAIQAALNDIIASDDMNSSRSVDRAHSADLDEKLRSPAASLVLFDRSPVKESKYSRLTSKSAEDLKTARTGKASSSAPASRLPSVAVSDVKTLTKRRSTQKLSLSPEKTSKHIFDDELMDDDQVSLEGEEVDEANELIKLAEPGDLQLSVEIARLQDKITELVQQDHLLDTLIRQAELTGNQAELRILQRSQSSVRREQRTAIFQKAQFEQQEEENRLIPGRTRVTIPSSVITTEDGESGKQVVRYTIEVSQVDEDQKVVLGWVVARRYNEFYELDKALKEWALDKSEDLALLDDMKNKVVEIPGKRLVPNTSASFVESRRAGLERYLQSLLASHVICDSTILRSFLSRSSVPLQAGSSDYLTSSTASLANLAPHNIVKSLYKTMATSLDDASLGPSMLDMMYTTLSRQLNDFGGLVGLGGEELVGLLPSALTGGPYTPQWLRHDPIASPANPSKQRIGPMGGESGMTSFTGPICDLFIEVFDLKENNWLRRQAIVVILQQFLGSTIERKVRDSFRAAISSESLEKIVSSLEETLFPGGERRPPSVARMESEKLATRIRASKKLGLLIPDIAANMIGRSNARRAARRVFGALQDTRLNQHLILSIMDEVLNAMFPSSP